MDQSLKWLLEAVEHEYESLSSRVEREVKEKLDAENKKKEERKARLAAKRAAREKEEAEAAAALAAAQAEASDKLLVVDFTATWCGPCQRIAPVFAKLAEEMPDIVFVKVAAAGAALVLARGARLARRGRGPCRPCPCRHASAPQRRRRRKLLSRRRGARRRRGR